MKKLILTSILLISINNLYSQDSSSVKYGFGLSIIDFRNAVDGVYTYHGYSPNFSIPIIINSNFKIEPTIGFYSRTFKYKSANDDEERNENSFQIGIGIFSIKKYDNLMIYYGGHLGVILLYKDEKDDNVTYIDEEGFGYFVSPAIGGEYFISDHFSVGGEIQFKYYIIESTEKLPNGSPPKIEYTFNSFIVRSMVILRFYL